MNKLEELAAAAAQTAQGQDRTTDGISYDILDKIIPSYDGNPKSLNFYIRSVEGVLAAQGISTNDPVAICLIRNKMTGKALEAISLEVDINCWLSLRQSLINRFGEQRSEIQILQELMRCTKSRAETCEAYGKKIRELLDALCGIGVAVSKQTQYYQTIAIDTFIDNLEYNIGLGVRIQSPRTLEAAIAIARQEEARVRRHTPAPSPQQPFRPPLPRPPNYSQGNVTPSNFTNRNTLGPSGYNQRAITMHPTQAPQSSKALVRMNNIIDDTQDDNMIPDIVSLELTDNGQQDFIAEEPPTQHP